MSWKFSFAYTLEDLFCLFFLLDKQISIYSVSYILVLEYQSSSMEISKPTQEVLIKYTVLKTGLYFLRVISVLVHIITAFNTG